MFLSFFFLNEVLFMLGLSKSVRIFSYFKRGNGERETVKLISFIKNYDTTVY